MYRKSGSSFDLKSIREYQSFDDPRSIDWRLYGRTDRAYVKEFREEAGEGVAMLLDVSGSLETADADAYRSFSASLAYILSALGIGVSIFAFDQTLRAARAELRSLRDFARVPKLLDALEFSGRTDIRKAISRVALVCRFRRLFMLTDCLDPGWDGTAPGFRTRFVFRWRSDIGELLEPGMEATVVDPESGNRITVPWDGYEAAAWKAREAAAMDRVSARGRGSWTRTISRGEDRERVYWETLERLHA